MRVEACAFSDERFVTLARLAELVDADHARGKMLRLWRQCTDMGTHTLSAETIESVLGPRGVEALLKSDLAERADSGIRIRGTDGRIEWLQKLRKNGKKGGRARAKHLLSQSLAHEEKETEKDLDPDRASCSRPDVETGSGSAPSSRGGRRDLAMGSTASQDTAVSPRTHDSSSACAPVGRADVRANTALVGEFVQQVNAARQRVAMRHGVTARPISEMGRGASELLARLRGAADPRADIAYVVAMAEQRAAADPEAMRWLGWSIAEEGAWRAHLADVVRKPAARRGESVFDALDDEARRMSEESK